MGMGTAIPKVAIQATATDLHTLLTYVLNVLIYHGIQHMFF
jgi:hypothetical protein